MAAQTKSSQQTSTSADSETIVNIDAQANNKENPVVKSLSAGSYQVKFIGTSAGGKYDAWSAWGITRECNEKGENCEWGWLNEYQITSNELAIKIPTTGVYETPQLALSKAQNTSFTLKSDGQVKFFIGDQSLPDNRGGVSLAVKKVSGSETDEDDLNINRGILLLVIITAFLLVLWVFIYSISIST